MYGQIFKDDLETYDYVLNDSLNHLFFQNETISSFEEEDFQRAKNEIYFNHSSNSNEKITSIITNQTEFHYKRKINSPSPKNKAIYGDKILDNYFYSFEQIKAIFMKYEKKFKGVYQKFTYNYNIESAEDKLCKRKRNRQMEESVVMKDESKKKIKIKIKRGRERTSNNKFYEEHTKMSGDNIIKKDQSEIICLLIRIFKRYSK